MSHADIERILSSTDDLPWFFISFCDTERPKGTRFTGGCYVQVPADPLLWQGVELTITECSGATPTLEQMLVGMAVARAHQLGINPGGEGVLAGPFTQQDIDENVPEKDRERLLSREEIEDDE